MTTVTEVHLQQDYEELGLDEAVPRLQEEQVHPQKVQKEIRPSDFSATSQEVLLIIQAGTDPMLVFRFCQGIRETAGADIAFVTNSPDGIAIKLALRRPVFIKEILIGMEEVEEASTQGPRQTQSNGSLARFLKPQTGKTIHITLKTL